MGQSSFEKGSETCIVHIVLYFTIYSMKKLLIAMVFVLSLLSFASADKLDDAISWMYDNGLTIHEWQMTYKADSWLRRDEAAKFYVNFSKLLGKTTYVKTASQCNFSDINDSWSDLKDVVVESCKLGLFQWSKGKFTPKSQLTNAQAITVLVRLLAGNQSEAWQSHRANNYYTKANELGILESVAMNSKDSIATRGNVGLIIYNGNNLQWLTNNNQNIITYNNSTYWFNLKLPNSRTWYIVTIQWNAIKFWFIEQSQVLTINAISHSEWNTIQNDLMHPTYLWENTNYVFVYSTAQDAANQTIANRMWEINDIVQTFQTN